VKKITIPLENIQEGYVRITIEKIERDKGVV